MSGCDWIRPIATGKWLGIFCGQFLSMRRLEVAVGAIQIHAGLQDFINQWGRQMNILRDNTMRWTYNSRWSNCINRSFDNSCHCYCVGKKAIKIWLWICQVFPVELVVWDIQKPQRTCFSNTYKKAHSMNMPCKLFGQSYWKEPEHFIDTKLRYLVPSHHNM